MKKFIFSTLVGLFILTTGCANSGPGYQKPNNPEVDVVAALARVHKPLFDQLISPLEKDKPLIAASFANIDDLTASSTFGRMASEVIAAGLTDRGFKVIEVKMRDSLFIKQRAGEFMLSRQLQHVSQEHNAQAVILGTYAIGGENLYVNVRVVRTLDNIVIGSHDFKLPLNQDIKYMLGIR